MKRFHANFAKPRAGWLPITISGDGDRIEIVASYTPRDSFTDLVSSVSHLYRTETEVIFNEEPEQRRLRICKRVASSASEAGNRGALVVFRAKRT